MRESVLTVRTICSRNLSSLVRPPPWPHSRLFPALQGDGLRDPLGHKCSPSFDTPPLRSSRTLFLPAQLFSGPGGVGALLGITGLHPGSATHPAAAHCSPQAGLWQPRRLRPGWPPRAQISQRRSQRRPPWPRARRLP